MKVSMLTIWFLTDISWALIAKKCKCTQINHWEDCISSKQKICSVCQTNFEESTEVTVTQCQHIFHFNCLSLWIEKNKDCPICHSVAV